MMTSEPASPPISSATLLAFLRAQFLPAMRSAAKWLTWIYVGGLALLLLFLERRGEAFWLTGILLFAPPQILLLPLVALTPFCALFRFRALGWHVVAVAMLFFGFMHVRWHPGAASTKADLSVVTHNTGQGYRPQFYDFLARQNPDVIVMQDAANRAAEFARKYPDRRVTAVGEFVLVSKWPILRSEAIPETNWHNRPSAARFELLCHDRPLIVYSVHLPTPRAQLKRFLTGRALAEMFADEDGSHPQVGYQEWTAARLKLAEALAGVLSKETLPFIVCGDFNTPDHGEIYRTCSRGLLDAHLLGGTGWGLTFPGATRNPLSLHGPWLRIDYAFAGRGWRPVWCEPEPGRRSQHCAVAAHFVSSAS